MFKSKPVLIFALSFVLSLGTHANSTGQEEVRFPILSKYRNWSFVAGPVIYQSATLERQYGNYSFENKAIPGYNIGLEYRFQQTERWSFSTGILVAKQPESHFVIKLASEDVHIHYANNTVFRNINYNLLSYSIPVIAQSNFSVTNQLFGSLTAGMKAMYDPWDATEYGFGIMNEDHTPREILTLDLKTPKNKIQGSVLFGGGVAYAFTKALVRANFICVFNIQNIIEGEYHVANLSSALPTGGKYKLSGNYVGLLFSVSLAKKTQQVRND